MTEATIAYFEKWAAENGGFDALRAANTEYKFGNGELIREVIAEVLRKQDAIKDDAIRQAEIELRRREVAAVETASQAALSSATSAQDSLTHSGQSARGAIAAAFFAFFALICSIAAYMTGK